MNNITRALAAILANTAFVWGGCGVKPDSAGLVTIPATWTSVPKFTFYVCAELKKVVIPEGVTELLYGSFYGSALEVVEFEANSKLALIGKQAFSKTSIKSIVIPQSVTEIGIRAFDDTSLEVVVFDANSQLETIADYGFYRTSIMSIVIPQGVTFFGNKVFLATPCDDITVFKPGNTVVNCEIIVPTPPPTTMVPAAPTTAAPTTMVPTTLAPTTAAPTTIAPTTAVPTTMVPTTLAPTTAAPTTMAPTTAVPTTMVPTTLAPTTTAPTTMAPTEVTNPCANLKKRKCKKECIFSKRQRQCLPKSISFEYDCARYEGKTPCLENKVCKFPHGKCIHRCDGKNAQRCRKHKFCNLDEVANPCFGCHLVTACGPRR